MSVFLPVVAADCSVFRASPACFLVLMMVVEGTGLGEGASVGGERGLVVGGGDISPSAAVRVVPGTTEKSKNT